MHYTFCRRYLIGQWSAVFELVKYMQCHYWPVCALLRCRKAWDTFIPLYKIYIFGYKKCACQYVHVVEECIFHIFHPPLYSKTKCLSTSSTLGLVIVISTSFPTELKALWTRSCPPQIGTSRLPPASWEWMDEWMNEWMNEWTKK